MCPVGGLGILTLPMLYLGGNAMNQEAFDPARTLQVMADEATPLSEGCEVAFFPPVTGG